MKNRMTGLISLAVLLILAALLSCAGAEEDNEERVWVNLNTQASPQAWIDGLDPEVPAGAFLTDNLIVPAFSVPDAIGGNEDYDLVIDLRGYTLTLTKTGEGTFAGPSQKDGIYIGYFNDVVIKNGKIKASGDGDITALLRDNGWKVQLEDVQMGDGTRTYKDGVLNVPWGELNLTGNSSVLQGADVADAIIIGQENSGTNAGVLIDTTGEVNGLIKVLPLNQSEIHSSLEVKNIRSTAAASSVTTPGGIRASMSYLTSENRNSIEISGGTWSAFILDGYCARGKVCVRVPEGDGFIYRIYDKNDNPAVATNGSSELLTFRFASLQDCVDNARYPTRQAEVTLVKDTELASPVTVNRNDTDLMLNLNGHTLTGNGGGVLINNMTNHFLSITDRVGGGQIGSGTEDSVQLAGNSRTYFGYWGREWPDEDTYRSFTVSGISVGTGTQTEVHAVNAFAEAHPVAGWAWVEDDTSDAMKLSRVVATRTTADGTMTSYTTLKDAVTAATTGDTVTLQDDVTLDNVAVQFTDGITATLDLGGHTIHANPAIIYPGKGSRITVKNGKILSTGNAIVLSANGGHMILSQGLTVRGGTTLVSAINGNGKITIDGAAISTTGDSRAAMVISSHPDQPATLEILSGSISSASGPVAEMINASRFEMSGGSVSVTGEATDISKAAIYCRTVISKEGAYPAITISGGEITSAGGYAIGASGAGSVTVTGGTLNGRFKVENGSIITTLSGGAFSGDMQISCGQATITGGEFNGEVGATGGNLTISGGRFKFDPSSYVAPDYKALEPGDDPMYRVIPDTLYTVTFDPANEKDAPWTINVESGHPADRPDDPEWEGHEFRDWFKVIDPETGELAETSYNFDLLVLTTLTLKARWTNVYPVTFLITEEGEEVPRIYRQQQVLENACATQPDDPYRYGYEFAGWRLKDATNNYSFTTPVTEDIDLYANWEPIPQYTVTFDSDGGNEVDEQTLYQGEMAFRPVNPEKKDSIFGDWYLVTDETIGETAEEPYDFSDPITKDITLKAKWIYTVTFDVDGGVPVDSQQVESDGNASKPEGPYKNSYAFDGWHLLVNGIETETEYNFNTPVTESITLRARWIPVWVVFFDKNNGEPEVSVPVISGQCIEADKIPEDPKREGLYFTGWFPVREDGSEEDDRFDFGNTTIEQDTTLRAKWLGVYYVIFDSDGGTIAATQAIVPGNKAAEPEKPVREGYVFAGWHLITFDTENREMIMERATYDFDTVVTGTIALKARWVDATKILTLPDHIQTVESEAFSGIESAEAVRLPGSFTGFGANSFDADLVVLVPKGSNSATQASTLGYLVVEE